MSILLFLVNYIKLKLTHTHARNGDIMFAKSNREINNINQKLGTSEMYQ